MIFKHSLNGQNTPIVFYYIRQWGETNIVSGTAEAVKSDLAETSKNDDNKILWSSRETSISVYILYRVLINWINNILIQLAKHTLHKNGERLVFKGLVRDKPISV